VKFRSNWFSLISSHFEWTQGLTECPRWRANTCSRKHSFIYIAASNTTLFHLHYRQKYNTLSFTLPPEIQHSFIYIAARNTTLFHLHCRQKYNAALTRVHVHTLSFTLPPEIQCRSKINFIKYQWPQWSACHVDDLPWRHLCQEHHWCLLNIFTNLLTC